MIVEIENINARVISATPAEMTWLREYLSFRPPVKFVRRADASMKPVPQSRQSLLAFDDSFPTGLTRSMQKAALAEGILVTVNDARTPPCRVLSWSEALHGRPQWLHDFQVEAVDSAIARTRGILHLPTGAGKTECAIGIALRLSLTNTLLVAPEKDLMHNAARRWDTRVPGCKAGLIGDGHFDPQPGFTAATFQTLMSRLRQRDPALIKYLGTVGCAIYDECHTLPAANFYTAASEIPAFWRTGLSGTPLARGDDRSLYTIAATGQIIYRVAASTLIERGFIALPHIRMVRCVQHGSSAKTWAKAEDELIITSDKRNTLAANLAARAPGPTLVFVRKKAHGDILTKRIAALGKRVEFIWGEKNTKQRDAAIHKLRTGQLDIIVCSVVFQTGTDIPEVQSIVIACGGKSEIAALQRVGRGMRVVRDHTGAIIKSDFYVFDIMDREPPGASDETPNKWNAKHSRERFESYTGAGYEVTLADAA